MKRFVAFRYHDHPKAVSIDMTPLIDVLFMLLLFFVLTSVFVDPAVPVNLPLSRENSPLPGEVPDIAITVDGGGRLRVNGEGACLESLEVFLFSWFGSFRDDPGEASPVVSIRGDEGAAYGVIFSVIDLLKEFGIERINLSHRTGDAAGSDEIW
ncbi:biopolymer transport protein ExbD/biopolymer transport protein TolR [Alkalispirochaeta americana]|uniref:Biopolymer transport protein ExbD/biopolymer transport protein TolR n=1 Tax=Alkalispirochaeta americana TaxID=159291 RepID=A0A1N6Q6I2_9SPIO|nr:biopolymer transporter ExbD [Alkalispirochaeta americana]SIQ12208.1 biopolymer transport protein ExbD/biopolymer transport protein TolR [Alkalispirochaeta americana]